MNNSKSWKLEQSDFSREKAAFWETLLTVGNGFIGMRGTPEEGGGPGSVQGTYLNGFYETAPIVYGEKFRGFAELKQTMLNIADARVIRLIVDGEAMTGGNGRVLEENRSLDMRRGILERRLVWRSSTGREVEVRSTRLTHQVRRALAMIEYTVTPLNFDGELVIQSGIDSGIRQSEHAEEDPRLGTRFAGEVLVTSEPATIRDGRGAALTQRTVASGLTMACGFTDRLSCPGDSTSWKSGGITGLAHHVSPKKGETVTLRKIMAYAAGPGLGAGLPVEERRKTEPASLSARLIQEVAEDLTNAEKNGFDILLGEHISYLEDFWKDSDITIDGDDHLQRGIRFNLLHLLQSTGRGGRTNIAAKGLTGLGYEGHTFWDTETYILPVFLFTHPDIAAALLQYRYNTLDAARDHAREMGHSKGALFPWRTINGRECSANFSTGSAQYHINADIAYAVKRYVDSTDDKFFLARYGAEILFETARIWFDTGSFSASKEGRFCINGVTGPDEYHILVDNNAYTNLMARENLRFAAEAVDRLRRDDPEALKDISNRISLDEEEPGQWRRAADAMFIPYDSRTGVIPQDEGFFGRDIWDFEHTPKDRYPLLLHYHPLTVTRYQVCKQADLLLAHFLLPDAYDADQKKRDFEYYEAITTHDSSLSACVFGILASELGYTDKAYRYFQETALADLDDTHGNTDVGIHAATMAGTWQSIVFGFAGMRTGDVLSFTPSLPDSWNSLSFRLRYRGRLMEVHIDHSKTDVRLLEGSALQVLFNGEERLVESAG